MAGQVAIKLLQVPASDCNWIGVERAGCEERWDAHCKSVPVPSELELRSLCLGVLAGKERVRVVSVGVRVTGRYIELLFPKCRAPHLRSSPDLSQKRAIQVSQSVSQFVSLCVCLSVCVFICSSSLVWSLSPCSLFASQIFCHQFFAVFLRPLHAYRMSRRPLLPSSCGSPARAHSSSVRSVGPIKCSVWVQRWTGRDYDFSGALDF